MDKMNDRPAPRARAGRPRNPGLDDAVCAATLALLAEHGYAQLTVEHIAARAGVGKASVYRRWPDKVSIVLDALGRSPGRPAAPDTGSLRDDALGFLRSLVDYRTQHAEAVAAISGEALTDPRFGEAFRTALAEPVMDALREIVERAIARGELSPGTDVELLCSVAPALLQVQRLLSGRQPDAAFAERIVAQFFTPEGSDRS
jgi:AcrR family transcriptional regulator